MALTGGPDDTVDPNALVPGLEPIQRWLTVGCRIAKRRTRLSAAHLLADPVVRAPGNHPDERPDTTTSASNRTGIRPDHGPCLVPRNHGFWR